MSRHGHRFYLSAALEPGATLTLPEQTSRQVSTVLRLKTGDTIRLFNGNGFEYPAEINCARRGAVDVRLTGCEPGVASSVPSLSIALSLIKSDRFEWALQKLTELGVDRVIPMETERSVLSLRVDRAEARRTRWQRIVIEAAEQSGRATLPVIDPVTAFADALVPKADLRPVLLWENERAVDLPRLFDQRPMMLLIGPEGGFSTAEVDLARANGVAIASLGPLTLRAETAAVTAAAVMLAHRMHLNDAKRLDDFGGHNS